MRLLVRVQVTGDKDIKLADNLKTILVEEIPVPVQSVHLGLVTGARWRVGDWERNSCVAS